MAAANEAEQLSLLALHKRLEHAKQRELEIEQRELNVKQRRLEVEPSWLAFMWQVHQEQKGRNTA